MLLWLFHTVRELDVVDITHPVRRVSLSMIDTIVVALSINVTVRPRLWSGEHALKWMMTPSTFSPPSNFPHHPTHPTPPQPPPKKTQWPPSSSPPAHSPTTRFKSPAKRSVPPAKTAVCATRSSRKIMRNTLRERSQGARSAAVSARVGMGRRIGWAV